MESTFWKLSIGLDEAAIKRIGLEHAGTAVNDVIERRGADVDRNTGLIAQAHIETAQQRAATGQQNAVVHKVRGKIGRRSVECVLDGLGHLVERLVERATNLLALDAHGLGQTGDHVAAVDLNVELVLERHGGTDLDLDVLCRTLADGQVVGITNVREDGLIELVAGNTNGLRDDDAAHSDNGDLGGRAGRRR